MRIVYVKYYALLTTTVPMSNQLLSHTYKKVLLLCISLLQYVHRCKDLQNPTDNAERRYYICKIIKYTIYIVQPIQEPKNMPNNV